MIIKINGVDISKQTKAQQEVAATIEYEEFVEPREKEEFSDPHTIYQLIPHKEISNQRAERLSEVVADTHREAIKRLNGFRLEEQDKLFFETIITRDSYKNYVITQRALSEVVKQQAGLTWQHVTVRSSSSDHLPEFNKQKTLCLEIKQRFEPFLSLKTDRIQDTPLAELLEISRFMMDDDLVLIQFGIQSVEKEWEDECSEKIEEFRKNVPKWWKRSKELSRSTKNKSSECGYDFVLRVVSYSSCERRRKRLARGVLYALKQLNGDNELIEERVNYFKYGKWLDNVKKRRIKIPLFGKRSILSTSEIGLFVKLPPSHLQETYSIIERVDNREIELSNELIKGGMLLGASTFKESKKNVYMAINNWEELCLPNIVIGGMGQGKTKGFLANWIVESVRNGFGALAIDPAKRQIGDEVEKVLNEKDVLRINLGQSEFSLDWCEALHDPKAKSRLAGTIIGFFENEEDTGGQTERFIRAAVMAMKTGKLREIIKIFTDETYLDAAIDTFREEDDLNKLTLMEYKGYQDGMRRKILSPIYNRLNTILSDPHLAACFKSEKSLDMVELMSMKKAIIIDVPADELDKIAIDIIVSLLSSKIDLAMRLRAKVKGHKAEFPFFILMDEPHQYLRSSKIWEAAAVESRKWRVGYVWAFHYWDQIPTKLQKAIKSALPHYHLYPSSKHTFKELAEEIAPFTVEDGLKLPSFHAINAIRVNGNYAKPFIAKMSPPPSERMKKHA